MRPVVSALNPVLVGVAIACSVPSRAKNTSRKPVSRDPSAASILVVSFATSCKSKDASEQNARDQKRQDEIDRLTSANVKSEKIPVPAGQKLACEDWADPAKIEAAPHPDRGLETANLGSDLSKCHRFT